MKPHKYLPTTDGRDRGLSALIFRSCARKDMEMGGPVDCHWLIDHQLSPLPLGLGQYVNDCRGTHTSSNVAYCEIAVPWTAEWLSLRHLLPFVYWSADMLQGDSPTMLHVTALVSRRKVFLLVCPPVGHNTAQSPSTCHCSRGTGIR